MSGRPLIPVAAACLVNARGEVLIAQRPEGKIAAGKWEFPGGKIEPGESAQQALVRELHEELGILVEEARPLIRVRHDYRDRTVLLDTWRVQSWQGTPQGREGQQLAWVLPQALGGVDLLAADAPIVNALRLPEHYVFTPPTLAVGSLREALPHLPPRALLRLRLPQLSDAQYAQLARSLAPLCAERSVVLMLDRTPELSLELGLGWHASVQRAAALQARPIPASRWFAGSAHTAEELAHLHRCGADFAVLGQVLATPTHGDRTPMGWTNFAQLARGAGMPVYAIGGVGPAHLPAARLAYAQGVAGIRAYWSV